MAVKHKDLFGNRPAGRNKKQTWPPKDGSLWNQKKRFPDPPDPEHGLWALFVWNVAGLWTICRTLWLFGVLIFMVAWRVNALLWLPIIIGMWQALNSKHKDF